MQEKPPVRIASGVSVFNASALYLSLRPVTVGSGRVEQNLRNLSNLPFNIFRKCFNKDTFQGIIHIKKLLHHVHPTINIILR